MSIYINQIHKQIGQVTVMDNITLDFPSGSLVALLGPSGCGKTTLLRIIAGLEAADSGNVLLHGEDISNTSARDRKVGFVFQHYALFRHMTIFDNVAFGLRVRHKTQKPQEAEIYNRVYNLLKLVQLESFADRYPSQLSGGQRQRIALARALAIEPRILLLDEPFGALDAQVRKELRRWLRKLHDELHITSIFVTHDQEEALEVSDHIVLMNKGRVEQIGSPDTIHQNPVNPFVYSFLGGLNLFYGQLNNGNLVTKDAVITLQQNDLKSCSDVAGFVRSCDLMIQLDASSNGIKVKVCRILIFGFMGRVETCDEHDKYYESELKLEEITLLELKEGQYVFIVPNNLQLFRSL